MSFLEDLYLNSTTTLFDTAVDLEILRWGLWSEVYSDPLCSCCSLTLLTAACNREM